jgi:two-component system response regulator ResD
MKIKILIADDDSILRDLLSDIIRKEGYCPLEAKNGSEALDLFYAHKDISLVILDVMMPIYDGWEVLKEIRQHSEVAIIMLTALGDEKHEISGLKKGANDYIAKPFSYEVFVARMNALLRKLKKENEAALTFGDIVVNQITHKSLLRRKKSC